MSGRDEGALPESPSADAGAHSPRSPDSGGQMERFDTQPWFREDLPLLHIYPQYQWHCEARIIGNAVGLRALAAALLAAADCGHAEAGVSVVDGEGYPVIAERTNDVGLRYTRLPYFPEYTAGETPSEHEGRLRQELSEAIAEIERLRSEAAQATGAADDASTEAGRAALSTAADDRASCGATPGNSGNAQNV